MNHIDTSAPSSARVVFLTAAGLLLAAIAAYHNSFSVPFLFDDGWSMADNPTIRNLWSWDVLRPPRAVTVGGRPVVNVTLAVSFALHGLEVWGYHAMNLAIHACAGLALFGLLRRTLTTPALAPRLGAASLPLASAIALLWTVHPMQTAAVTYVVQRAECLVSLFYLLTLYSFVRGTTSARPHLWNGLAIAACLLGMGSKEVMASAPLIVLLYDRTLVAGSFGEAWRRRRPMYLGLFATWLLLAFLVATTGDRGGTAGLTMDVAWWSYALLQFRAIVRYLRLAIWPSPLIFDYGTAVVTEPWSVAWEAALVLGLLAATAVAIRNRHPAGVAGAAFFGLLAPSSSVIPVATQTMTEHRLYLALAPVLTLLVLGLHRWLGRRTLAVCLVWAAALSWLTVRRNADYRDATTLWADTVAKLPTNARAQSNLGVALFESGRAGEAIPPYEAALALDPGNATYHINLGNALFDLGRAKDALDQYAAARTIDPTLVQAHYNYGNALGHLGRLPEAVAAFEEALRIDPEHAESRVSLAFALAQLGRTDAAIASYEEAVRLDPGAFQAHFDLAGLLAGAGRLEEAAAHYEDALRIEPASDSAHNNLAGVLLQLDRLPEAVAHGEAAVKLNPENRQAVANLTLLRERLSATRR